MIKKWCEKAIFWYEQAASHDHVDAMRSLANLYLEQEPSEEEIVLPESETIGTSLGDLLKGIKLD